MNARQEAAAAKREALLEDLHKQVETLTTGDRWINYLAFAAKFRRYSFNNQMLIWMQRPETQAVAGYQKWQEMGRQVRKGAKAVQILGFREYVKEVKGPDGKPMEERRAYFPAVNVFDYDDTDPIEGAARVFEPENFAERLTGEDESGICVRVEDWLRGEGWTVERRELSGAMNGYTTTDGTYRVVVSSEISDAQAAKTLIHEAAHVILHTENGKGDHAEYIAHRGLCEVEAESVAYVVAGSLGLNTSGYSVGYVAQWAEADHDLIQSTGERVMKAAKRLCEALDHE